MFLSTTELKFPLLPPTLTLIRERPVMHGDVQTGARFSDTGAGFAVTFDRDTDYGASLPLGGTFKCPLLLDYPGASDSDICSWTSGAACALKGITYHWLMLPIGRAGSIVL